VFLSVIRPKKNPKEYYLFGRGTPCITEFGAISKIEVQGIDKTIIWFVISFFLLLSTVIQ